MRLNWNKSCPSLVGLYLKKGDRAYVKHCKHICGSMMSYQYTYIQTEQIQMCICLLASLAIIWGYPGVSPWSLVKDYKTLNKKIWSCQSFVGEIPKSFALSGPQFLNLIINTRTSWSQTHNSNFMWLRQLLGTCELTLDRSHLKKEMSFSSFLIVFMTLHILACSKACQDRCFQVNAVRWFIIKKIIS